MDASKLHDLEKEGYILPESFDTEKTEKIAHHYGEILRLLGEDCEREHTARPDQGAEEGPHRHSQTVTDARLTQQQIQDQDGRNRSR